jgi:hypothetical protein
MKYVYFTILCCFCLTSCHAQIKNKEMKYDLNISLLFYPSMSIEDIRYSINIISDSLIIKKYSIGVETAKRIKLIDEQCLEIKKMISVLTQKYDMSKNSVLGGWGCTLKIDNQVYYEDNFFSFVPISNKAMGWQAPPKKIKLLIDYIVGLSPISIELYSFS